MGQRSAEGVRLNEGWKCNRCEYAQDCDLRVHNYKRVGKLIIDSSKDDMKDTRDEIEKLA